MGSKCVFAIRFSFTRMKHLAIWTVNLKKKVKKEISCSPWNENLNLLVCIKFLNLFLYTVHVVLLKKWKIYWSKQSFTGLGLEDRCSILRLQLITLWSCKITHCIESFD
jgi:hypothetical protein